MSDAAREELAYAIGVRAYIWGYHVVTNETGSRVGMAVSRSFPTSSTVPSIRSFRPDAAFHLPTRMYLPSIEVLNGQYEIPGIHRVSES